MPLCFAVAFLTVATVVKVVASMRGVPAMDILKTDTLWPLCILLPAFFLGKTLGLIALNVFARITPMGRVFDRESAQTGRHGFAKATGGLSRLALVNLLVTTLSCGIYLWLAPV